MGNSYWDASAGAWIAHQDRGETNRVRLLDGVMLRLCGDVAGQRVLDVGCGEGRFGRMLAVRGARVTALDATRELIATARDRGGAQERFVHGDGARLPLAASVFDLVVSYVALVDIPDFRAAIAEMARVLAPGARIVVANVSFMSAATGWIRDEQGRRLHYPIDDYFTERSTLLEWQGIRILNWHRPLGAYMAAYLGAGLVLREFIEPYPEDDSFREDSRYEDWYRAPNFTVMAWERPG